MESIKKSVTDNNSEKSKLELIEEALLKNVTGGSIDTCGSHIGDGSVGRQCWHDTCYEG